MKIGGIIALGVHAFLFFTLDDSMSFRVTLRNNIFGFLLRQRQPLQTKLSSESYYNTMAATTAGTGLTFSVGMDPYCYKQFDEKQENHIPCTKELFLDQLRARMQSNQATLADGYAPFCKHLFLENFTDAQPGSMAITDENRHMLRSGYVARNEKELPVLSRWFPRAEMARDIPKAKFLDVILYSREQVIKENEARGEHQDRGSYKFDYYVIAIKPQDIDRETPMMPITIFRNTMIEEGGSGVPIDHAKYMEAVEFWQNNAVVKDHM